MSFTIQQAARKDAPKLAKVYFAAFCDEFSRKMFPPVPEVQAWVIEHFLGGSGTPEHEVFLKITDPSDPDAVVAFAKWVCPADAATRDSQSEQPAWPASCNAELCERFFRLMEENHHRLMGDRPHYYLDILCVNPSFQGLGLGSMLLEWGLSRADEDGLEVCLSSSPEGRRLYEKHGFQRHGEYEPYPAREQWTMLRPVQT